MTLDAARIEFERLFASVRSSDTADASLGVIWSGGQRRPEDTSAALYASRDLAVVAWLETARSYAIVGPSVEGVLPPPSACVLEWFSKPELIEYQMTMADMKQRHRVVGNRYAVRSQFKVVQNG